MSKITNRFLRSGITLVLVLAMLLSGIPSADLSEALRDKNIVDVLYLALKDGNVIDKGIKDLWKSKIQKAYAGDFQMQTGYYMGTGLSQTIDNLGFEPDMLIVKANTTASMAVLKTSAMPAGHTAPMTAAVINKSNQVILRNDGFTVGEEGKIALDSDGFSVKESLNVANENVRYNYVAFGGSDCTATGNFCVGTYTGNGSNPRNIDVGFLPSFVMIKSNLAVASHFHTENQPANESLYFTNAVRSTDGSLIRDFTGTGFNVGSSDNTAGNTYYYAAFATTTGAMFTGTYTANNTDNRAITGVGFQPDFMLVKNATNTTANNTYASFNLTESYEDASSYFTATNNASNNIQSLDSDGFTLGNSVYVNGSASDTQYYVAFGGAGAPSASGTFKFQVGSYTGNGVSQSITGLDFSPDLVIIKSNAAQLAVFRTKLMSGNTAAYLGSASANLVDAILSIDSDGFTVGGSVVTNQSGTVFHYQVFGNAYDPIDNAGAADFIVGAYTGNGISNRTISRLPFQPDLVTVKSIDASGAGVWRPSYYTYDSSFYFANTATTTEVIKTLNSDGFDVGTNAATNANLITYFWFAFKNGTNFNANGMYTGDTIDGRQITGLGLNPALVWVKRTTNVNGVFRPGSLAGDATQYFAATANATNRIQNLIPDGFELGGSQIETNASGGIYYYAAWATTTPDTGTPGTPGTPTFSNVEKNSLTVSWTSGSSADYYEVERTVYNTSLTIFSRIATTTSLTINDSGLTASTTYAYRVRGINSNGNGVFTSLATATTDGQSYAMQTGYYTGNAGLQSITGLGFSPEMLIIKSNTAAVGAVFKTAAMKKSDMVSVLNTVSNAVAQINTENIRYQWIAFAGSNCSSGGKFCVGAYTGDGVIPRDITVGFQVGFAIVKRDSTAYGHFRTNTEPANESLYFHNAVRVTNGTLIRSFATSTAMTVGSTDNALGGIYYYATWATSTGAVIEGTYTANNTDNRSITGVGFTPNWVMTKNATNATAANTYAVFNSSESYEDNSSYFSATANLTNTIQELESDGFEVGTSILVNGSASDTHYYVAFGGASAPAGTGTFTMTTGSYSGNGTTQSISGLGFTPDLVIIKSNTTNLAVFRTKLMYGDSTSYFSATANLTSAIKSIDSDGFTIGGDSRVNTNTVTYYYQAFGNAYDPIDNTGAADFAIGAIYGNGITDRSIIGVPFQPDMVAIKSMTSAGGAVWHPSVINYDSSLYFINTASTTEAIKTLNSDGFNIGTSATANTAAVMYHWFAFKNGANFTNGSYTGNTSDNRDITGLGLNPDLVFVKRASNTSGVHKSVSVTGDATQYFTATANVADRIQSLITDGFQVGGNQAETNASNIVYFYAAWEIPEPTVISISISSDGIISYGTLDTNTSTTTLPADMPPSGDMQTAQNDSNVTVNFNIRGYDASGGGCTWTLAGSNGSNQYVHQFCNDTDNDCTSPPTSYTALDTAYSTLDTSIAEGAGVNFQLRLTTPTASSCYGQQDVDITVMAVEP